MLNILVIEDDTNIREQLVELLTLEGYVAIGAGDGAAGLEAALGSQPDVILSDIAMPKVDGYEVLRQVRAHTVTATIPFIFLSARAAKEDTEKGLWLGANAYLTKPFQIQDLLQLIHLYTTGTKPAV